MSRAFEPLRERLLGAGIAGGPARRYIAELSDHLEDLRTEERRAGASPQDAEARAMQRLGDTEALADAMIARREFRAWGARAPVAVYVVTPSVILAIATAFWLVALVGACTWLRHAAWGPTGWEAWMRPLADGLAWVSNTKLPIVLGWGLAASGIRQRAPMPWPLVGLLLLAAVGAALQIQVTLPAGSAPGEIEVPPFVLSSYGGRFALDFILTAAPFVLIHRWLTTHRTAA